MQHIQQIGAVSWSNEELKWAIPTFLELYQNRPIKDNQGGMKAPHAFATWFMLQKLRPKNVIESGIWKGQSTWLIENAVPEAKIYSLDINLSIREYISESATYYEKDFFEVDWTHLDKSQTVLFFDDHQNALERIRKGQEMGFKRFIFEDNYPAGNIGDCYSLKKAFQYAGFQSNKNYRGVKSMLREWLKPSRKVDILPNKEDAQFLSEILEVYYEFPPVFKATQTRWGDDWTENNYPTPQPLYTAIKAKEFQVFEQEARDYTWICYAQIK